MTKIEKAHYSKLSQLGCIVCLREGFGYSPPHIHHIRTGQGMAQRADYLDAIPLCPNHHQNGGYGVALHAGQGKFESRFGTEIELLKHTKRLIGIES
ncbi:Recombination enhancement, RecA-dependent nuclease [uncultured Caudovirales phage]|uniref:Recombination enhancement, RecA-dependent nuclease n=1 Tax=uncultured Caudovirales phage TaxID=2100421 RepID=A0A6J5LGL6_9CAUD|nr:Recombination enhancement, RecA-dependent nuclease [uncultured Caudovirales phage]